MTNRFNRSSLGEAIVSIALEIHKREDNKIPPYFIREVKTKSYDMRSFAQEKKSQQVP